MKRNSVFLSLLAILNCVLISAQAGNVGVNTPNPGSKLTVNGSFAASYKTVTTNTVINADDFYVAYNGSTNGILTLPSAIGGSGNFVGRTYHFKNTGNAMLSITASGTELIDNQSGAGVSSVDVPPGYYAFFISKGTTTGTTWELILISSSTSLPAASTNYLFSTIPTSTRQTLTATTGPYIRQENNYPNGTVINTGNVLNISNGRFTAPTSGYYMFYGSTQFDNALVAGQPAFGFTVLYLVKNYSINPDNILVQFFQPNPGTQVASTVSCVAYLNAGETVSMASAATVTTGSVYQVVLSTLYGYKIAN
ncbi:hypothetical protein GCM10022217_10420 [Chryseobacterium ginsenosidimutans]|uniref:hypothetical protein n=1 Tax=Chryseobacterium ginsenosidimutans TaxID=687846 RepID=UPI0031E1E12B